MSTNNDKQPTYPTKTLLQGKVYTRHTDVQATWRAFGWKPTKKQQKGTQK